MATTTTNFGWDIPQSTDLVKDGATAIAALGQDIDTALVDLKGGTTGQVLSKASGTDLDFSWASAPSSALTLITTQALSGVTSQSINNCFSATYQNYVILFSAYNATSTNVPTMKLRASGTDSSANYYGCYRAYTWAGALVEFNQANTSSWSARPFGALNSSSTAITGIAMHVFNPFQATNTSFAGNLMDPSTTGHQGYTGGIHNSATSYDGFTITNATAMTGTVRVYGLAN